MITEEVLTLSALGLGFGVLMFFTILVALFLIIIVFLYKAFALYTIAKKLGSKHAYLAWIPIAQFFLYPILADEKWEWGLIALLPIVTPLLFIPFAIIPFVNFFLVLLIAIGVLTLIAFRTYWIWKIFEKRNYHGALSLLTLISIANLIILGIVAWKDNNKKSNLLKKDNKVIKKEIKSKKINKKSNTKKR